METRLTLDPVENRGFEYHTGIGFTVFARGVREELGSGGRYRARIDAAEEGERATGFTLYVDHALRMIRRPPAPRRLLVPLTTPAETADALRAEGWVTLAALEDGGLREQARRLGCGHYLKDGRPAPVDEE